MLSPETNATAEEKMPGGRVTKWVKKNDKFLLGAGIGSGGAIAGAVAVAAATAPAGNGIDPAILEHAQENSVTIYAVALDANGEIIGGGQGAGFFIAGTDGRLIGTAAHNFPDPDLPAGAELLFVVETSGGERFLVKPPSGTAVDADNDLAIVDLGQTTNYTGIEIAPEGSAELGEEMWSVGPEGVKQLHIGSLKPGGYTGPEDVHQLDGTVHEGESGRVLIDTDGRATGMIVSGDRTYPRDKEGKPLYDKDGNGKPDFDDDLTTSYATKSERLKELSERYQASPEFIHGPDVSVVPKSSFSGGAEELAADVAIQQSLKAKSASFSPDDAGVSDIVPVMADPSGGTGPWSPGFSPDDAGVLKNFLVIGDQSSVIGSWPPLGSSDDGGAIDSLLEALDALG